MHVSVAVSAGYSASFTTTITKTCMSTVTPTPCIGAKCPGSKPRCVIQLQTGIQTDFPQNCGPQSTSCELGAKNCTSTLPTKCLPKSNNSNCFPQNCTDILQERQCTSTLNIEMLNEQEKIYILIDASNDKRQATESDPVDLGLKYSPFLKTTLYRVPGRISVSSPPMVAYQPPMRVHFEAGEDLSLQWKFITAPNMKFVLVRERFQISENVTISILYDLLHNDFPEGGFGETTFYPNIRIRKCIEKIPTGTQEDWNIELFLRDIKSQDEGVYSLTYKSPLNGMTTITTSLISGTKVYPFPEYLVRFFVMYNQDTMSDDQKRLYLHKGKETSLICRVIGYGVSHVQLLKKGKLVESYDKNAVMNLTEYFFPGIGFHIPSPSRTEAGRYMCRAFTNYGRYFDRKIVIRIRS